MNSTSIQLEDAIVRDLETIAPILDTLLAREEPGVNAIAKPWRVMG
jgi:hypothetical protein